MKNYFSKKDIPVYILLTLLCVFLFKDVLFRGEFLFGSDFGAFYLDLKHFLYNEIHNHGSIPFWNPYIFGGMPFWAHFESTIFYPLDILFWVIPPEAANGYTMFIHMLFAGFFYVSPYKIL